MLARAYARAADDQAASSLIGVAGSTIPVVVLPPKHRPALPPAVRRLGAKSRRPPFSAGSGRLRQAHFPPRLRPYIHSLQAKLLSGARQLGLAGRVPSAVPMRHCSATTGARLQGPHYVKVEHQALGSLLDPHYALFQKAAMIGRTADNHKPETNARLNINGGRWCMTLPARLNSTLAST